MHKIVLTVVIALALSLGHKPASAGSVVVDFSFVNSGGAFPNLEVITGQIFGLVDNASGQQATDVKLTSKGGLPFLIDVTALANGSAYANSFSVVKAS